MPVHTITRYCSDCDECEWVSEYCDWYDQAQELLDNHIKDKH